MLDAQKLAALMCSRLCHELMSPVSAASHALELYHDPPMPDNRDEAVKVLDQGVGSAAAKLRFFRVAFGAYGAWDQPADLDEAAKLAQLFFTYQRAELHWRASAAQPPLGFVRLILNLCLIALDSLPRGGRIDVSVDESDAGWTSELRAQGPRAALRPLAASTFAGSAAEEDYDGRSIQQYFTQVIADSVKARIVAVEAPELVTLSASIARTTPA